MKTAAFRFSSECVGQLTAVFPGYDLRHIAAVAALCMRLGIYLIEYDCLLCIDHVPACNRDPNQDKRNQALRNHDQFPPNLQSTFHHIDKTVRISSMKSDIAHIVSVNGNG